MEEITIKYYQIPLYKLQELHGKYCFSENVLNEIPEVNFNVMHYYKSSTHSLNRSISDTSQDFFIPSDWIHRELKHYFEITNAINYPEAILRFRKNILADHNI